MKRSKFNLSNYKLFSCDMGELIPCGLLEVLPGDTIQQATSALVRCSPLLAPVMHPVHVKVHHWFVPNRIIWNDWEDFITGGPDGLNASIMPTVTINNAAVGSLADYLGIPTGVAQDRAVCALPFRAYALIWNEFYRDQDLQTPLTIDLTDGPDSTTNVLLQNVAWEKDYFTTARPWVQKGPAITVPLAGTAPVGYVGTGTGFSIGVQDGTATWRAMDAAAATVRSVATTPTSGYELHANLAAASGVSVNMLREALSLQRFQEARARFGSRYVEYLRYLSVRSSDARLQRPEYLGGGTQTIQFSEVLQTAPFNTPAATNVGELRGHGIGAMRTRRYRRFFEEHGWVLSLMSVKPRTMYSDGIYRHWSRTQKEDYWQKELQYIGQQEVLNQEVRSAHAMPTGVFGYQDRYDEYRRQESSIAGEFRTTVANFWHMARQFSADPALNASFVSSVPTKRVFAVTANDGLYVMARHNIVARRLVIRNANPRIE